MSTTEWPSSGHALQFTMSVHREHTTKPRYGSHQPHPIPRTAASGARSDYHLGQRLHDEAKPPSLARQLDVAQYAGSRELARSPGCVRHDWERRYRPQPALWPGPSLRANFLVLAEEFLNRSIRRLPRGLMSLIAAAVYRRRWAPNAAADSAAQTRHVGVPVPVSAAAVAAAVFARRSPPPRNPRAAEVWERDESSRSPELRAAVSRARFAGHEVSSPKIDVRHLKRSRVAVDRFPLGAFAGRAATVMKRLIQL
jgi:hypothetical protein